MKTLRMVCRLFALSVFAFLILGMWCKRSHPDWGWSDCYGLHHENNGEIGKEPENQAKFRALDPKLQKELLARWDPKEKARRAKIKAQANARLRKVWKQNEARLREGRPLILANADDVRQGGQ